MDNTIDKQYDIVIIGGGATGAGIALDASLRGLSVILFEQNDFAEGTSSRSTKLIHGGVRYLEAAVKRCDRAQYSLVKEGLRERKLFLQNAPHLANTIELITPLYRWWEVPYIYAGLFLYDIISGNATLGKSKILSAKKTLALNPAISPKGLKAAVSYYDGTFNDSRMTIALLQSAQENGAGAHNHHKLISFQKKSGKIVAVSIWDKLSSKTFSIEASIVINATGPFIDEVRKLDEAECKQIIQTSSGIHIIVDKKFLPSPKGIMIPKTSDGRVLFVLPYQGNCLIGTNDIVCNISEHPRAEEEEISYLLKNINEYLNIHIYKYDILATFAGIRPLLKQNEAKSTATIAREHIAVFSNSGLMTVAGGKWTSYRSMSESTIDLVLQKLGKTTQSHPCKTNQYRVVGSQKDITATNIEKHLKNLYGDQSYKVIEIANSENASAKLHPKNETMIAELLYCIRYEYVKKPLDFIVRRINLGLKNRAMSLEILPRVCDIMQDVLRWDKDTRDTLELEAKTLLTEGV
ncbi:MAG: FAD-dependent oxidoreductase [Sulfurovum sp.]|nr:FAD-dependent oxidoreductase [Sulfurovum sp.]